jgi:transcriptional regulator
LGKLDKLDKLDKQLDLLQGTLDLLILKAVSLGPLHGYGVLLRIQQISGETLTIQQGSLYPALYRLEHQGLIGSEWGESDNNRKAKFYQLTSAGRLRLEEETEKWNRMAEIMGNILTATPQSVEVKA